MKKLLIIILAAFTITTASAQFSSVRTNGLLWLTGTINAGIDVRVHDHLSVDALVLFNPIKTKELSMQVLALQPALRYWIYETGVGPFFSLHGSVASYNVGNRNFYYKGMLAGAGLSFGYSWLLTKRWNIGFEVGVSALFMKDTRRDNNVHYTQDEYIYNSTRWIVAPSKLELSLSYLF